MTKTLGKPVVNPIGETTINLSIHEYNSGALILANTLQPHFTPQSNNVAAKTIWFCNEILKSRINLFNIDTVEKLGEISAKGLTRVNSDHLRKKLMGWYMYSVFSFVVTF